MDITEMCRVLDISTKTGYRLLKNGDISSLKIGRAYRIPKAHLLAYLKIRKASGLWLLNIRTRFGCELPTLGGLSWPPLQYSFL